MPTPEFLPDFRPLTDEIHRLLVLASGLSDQQVLLADQDAPASSIDYLTFRLLGGASVGGARGEQITEDPEGEPGQEMILASRGSQEASLYLQAFTRATDPAQEQADAGSLLRCVQAQLRLTPTRDALYALGVSIFDFGVVQGVPGVYGSKFEGRATLDLRLYVNEGASWRTGYIASCTPSGTLT